MHHILQEVDYHNFNSIKVQLRHKRGIKLINVFHDFNSIKVQLRLISDKGLILNLLDFNSIKVQLRPAQVLKYADVPEFQFHKGTIKTFKVVVIVSRNVDFNSIKVQLRRFN